MKSKHKVKRCKACGCVLYSFETTCPMCEMDKHVDNINRLSRQILLSDAKSQGR
jgi:uncharacterized Zn finger protein (UPF0148 family)